MEKKQVGGYMADCQLGKRGTSEAGGKRRDIKEGRGKHERKTIILGISHLKGLSAVNQGFTL